MAKLEKHRSRSERGQSTVEFVLSLVLLMSFVLFYVQLTLVFAWGSWTQYAVFMAARAYLAAGPSEADQIERASDTIKALLKKNGSSQTDKIRSVAQGQGDGDIPGAKIGRGEGFQLGVRGLSWRQGVRYSFRSRIFVLPFGRSGARRGSGGANTLDLTSEAWLGREPDSESCLQSVSRKSGIVDNGC